MFNDPLSIVTHSMMFIKVIYDGMCQVASSCFQQNRQTERNIIKIFCLTIKTT